MIFTLGFYESISGKLVKIEKIYQNQNFSEGWIVEDGVKTTSHVWNTATGKFSRYGEHDNDLKKFLYPEYDPSRTYDE